MQIVIGRGAEAILFEEKEEGKSKTIRIVKDRIEKKYRHKVLDEKLRFSRTRREAKVLEKLAKENFPCPILINQSKDKISISLIEGRQLKEVFDDDCEYHSKEIAKLVAKMHNLGIIHGDLTTSNMIFDEDKINNSKNQEVHKHFLVDFGLSFFSESLEDKAVDIHLFDRAIDSRHYKNYQRAMKVFLEEYSKHAEHGKNIVKRFQLVQMRGRNKAKY